MSSDDGTRARALRARDLALPVALGMALRTVGLSRQVLGDDELHAVRAALSMSIGEILATFRITDHSIPLTALYRLALDAGLALDDGVLRAPPLAGSLALLALVPLAAGPLVGRAVALRWAWLLALLPLLASYGAMVRSYALVVPAATLALVAFARFWEGENARFGIAYCALGGFAIWLHVGAGPFVAGALAFAAIDLAAGRRLSSPARESAPPRTWVQLGILAIGLLAAGGALLAPAAASLRALVAAKTGARGPSLATVFEAAQLHAGVAGPAAVIVGLVASLGAYRGFRDDGRERALLCCAGIACASQAIGLALLSPKLDSPLLLARAFLVALPALALFVSVGLAGPPSERGGRRAAVSAAAAFVAWLVAGPLLDPGRLRTSFRHHDDFVVFTRPRAEIPPAELDPFYADLSMGAIERGPVIEIPWHPFWGFGHAIVAYQEVHGEQVIVAMGEGDVGAGALALRNAVALDPVAILETRARHLVVHRDLEREEARARAWRGSAAPARSHDDTWRALRAEAARARALLERAYGPPDRSSAALSVWDLARVRSASAIDGSAEASESSTARATSACAFGRRCIASK